MAEPRAVGELEGRAESRKVDDLEVEVSQSAAGELEVRILRSPFNRPRSHFISPWPEGEARELAAAFGSWVNHYIRTGGSPGARQPPDAEDTGRRLFESLFPPPLLKTFDLCAGIVLRSPEQRALRLRVSFDTESRTVNEVAVLPWELLRDPSRGAFLALDPRTPIVRYLDSTEPLRLSEQGPTLRVLLVGANPKNTRRKLNLESEKKAICKAVRDTEKLEIETLARPTLDDLYAVLNDKKIHVLHFMGHGGFDERGGYVAFENSEGDKRTVTDKDLATLIPRCGSLQLVVLAACKGAQLSRAEGSDSLSGVAAGLTQKGLAGVLGMQFVVSDRAAARFSAAFYGSLVCERSVEVAVTEGRLAILRGDGNSLEWASPVLFLRAPELRLVAQPMRQEVSVQKRQKTEHLLGIFSFGKDLWGHYGWKAAEQRLDLTPYFKEEHDGRYIRNDALWSVVGGEVARFLPGVVSRSQTNVLEMAAHLSVAYSAGRSLEAMSGYRLVLRQRSADAIHDWRLDEGEVPGELWPTLEDRPLHQEGQELALVVSISQGATKDAAEYLKGKPEVGRLLVASLGAKKGQLAIKSGAHAFELAQELYQWVREKQGRSQAGPLHLFIATPGSFAFILGRLTRDWGEVQLYEHDRDGKVGTVYFPSFRVGGES